MSDRLFATFWSGPLNALVASCLSSFPARGARLRLYAYEKGVAAPPGVEIADAREICADPSLMRRYFFQGRPSLAIFADRFRYELLSRVDCCWVDADMFALAPDVIPASPIVWGFQPPVGGESLVNNAVLQLPRNHPVLVTMLARARAAEGSETPWGAIGPFLLDEIARAEGARSSAAPPERFYPVAPDDFWRLFDPDACAEIEAACAGAAMAHLWSELLRRLEWDFDAAPPQGAYLHRRLDEIGALSRFCRSASLEEVRLMRDRWLASAPQKAAT